MLAGSPMTSGLPLSEARVGGRIIFGPRKDDEVGVAMANPMAQPEPQYDNTAAEPDGQLGDWEQRRDHRRRVLKGATVAYNNRHCTISCMIRDISTGGARLSATSSVDIPDTFELIVELDGLEAECEVVWRYGKDIGVRFLSPLRQSARKRDQVIAAAQPQEKVSLRRKDREQKPRNDNKALRGIPREHAEAGLVTAELAEHGSHELQGTASVLTPSNEASYNFLALLVTLQPEVSRSCVLIAISACVSNALVSSAQQIQSRELIRYFPRESANLILASQRIDRWYGSLRLNELLKEFNATLAGAKEATIDIAGNGLAWGRPGQKDFIELATHWKNASHTARNLLLELADQFAACGLTGAISELSLLLKLLANVANGGYPLVSMKGDVSIPEWFETRHHERALLRCPADLYVNNQSHKVLVRDFSAVGLGIECQADISTGDFVEIQVGSSLRLRGTVIWSSAGRAGVQFSQPIHGLDPWMMFCSRNEANNIVPELQRS